MHSQCVALVILYSITQSQAVVQNESPAAAQNQNINSSDLPGIPSDLASDTKSIQLKRPRLVNQNDSDHSVLKSHRVTASGLSSAGSSGSANTSSSVGGMMWKFKSMKPKRTLWPFLKSLKHLWIHNSWMHISFYCCRSFILPDVSSILSWCIQKYSNCLDTIILFAVIYFRRIILFSGLLKSQTEAYNIDGYSPVACDVFVYIFMIWFINWQSWWSTRCIAISFLARYISTHQLNFVACKYLNIEQVQDLSFPFFCGKSSCFW